MLHVMYFENSNVLCLQGLVEVEVEAQVEMVTGLASKLMLTL